jgi:NADPH:quinone reductase-like Zn-dependent oxidoreductase
LGHGEELDAFWSDDTAPAASIPTNRDAGPLQERCDFADGFGVPGRQCRMLRVCHGGPRSSAADEAGGSPCSGVTTYKGLKETEATPGQWMVVSGVGGLGHATTQYARAKGLHVTAIDVDEAKLQLA